MVLTFNVHANGQVVGVFVGALKEGHARGIVCKEILPTPGGGVPQLGCVVKRFGTPTSYNLGLGGFMCSLGPPFPYNYGLRGWFDEPFSKKKALLGLLIVLA